MTNGTSQGLFVIIAVVIFGIFVGISYLLFQDRLQIGLSTIFDDSIAQTINKIEDSKKEKFENSYIYKEYEMGLALNSGGITTSMPTVHQNGNNSIYTFDVKSYINRGFDVKIEDGFVFIGGFTEIGVKGNSEVITDKFGDNFTRKEYITINDNKEIFLGSTSHEKVTWQQDMISNNIKLKINQNNRIKLRMENIHGGNTFVNFDIFIKY